MIYSDWLSLLMDGAFCEVILFDPRTLKLLRISNSAQKNLQFSHEAAAWDLKSIAPLLNENVLSSLLQKIEAGEDNVTVETHFLRKDGSSYPVELKLFRYQTTSFDAVVAIANDISIKQESAIALNQSETRLRAIVSHLPGLAYQFRLDANGATTFPYLSEGCHALLGMTADQLHVHPEMLVERIVPEDRPSYLASMGASARELTSWNWDGRLWIAEWNDIKWVNLRATPRALADGSIQWEGIMTNITQSKLEEVEIKASRSQLAELTAHVDKVKEQERKHIAREIHDDLGGNLTAIKMALALLTKRLPEQEPELLEKAAYVDQLVDRTIDSVHRIAGDLRPGVLDFGIVAAIEWQASEFEKQLGIPCEVESNISDIELHADHATALFRIFQEGLTNISKHANATSVSVILRATVDVVRLDISDNGRGITKQDRFKTKSFGIRGMAERAKALGGTFRTSATQGGGCTVSICIPRTHSNTITVE